MNLNGALAGMLVSKRYRLTCDLGRYLIENGHIDPANSIKKTEFDRLMNTRFKDQLYPFFGIGSILILKGSGIQGYWTTRKDLDMYIARFKNQRLVTFIGAGLLLAFGLISIIYSSLK